MSRPATICALLASIVFLPASFAFAQSDDPFSIRVQANQVLVRVEVFRSLASTSAAYKAAYRYWDACMQANHDLLDKLPMSQPYLNDADCVKDWEVNDLEAKDFHVFQDGVEQKIDSVVHERAPWNVERKTHSDFNEQHKVWSHTPRGVWRTPWTSADWRTSAEYAYRISYTPPKLQPGSCHRVKVKVERRDVEVVATDSYCYIEHPANDPLMGTNIGKQLEAELASDRKAKIPLAVETGFFYTDAQIAKLNIVVGFPPLQLKYERVRGETRASIEILGVAYTATGSVAARFSDVAMERGDKAWSEEAIADLPREYETQIDLPPGTYKLRILLSDGSKFGRADIPVTIEDHQPTQLSLSSLFIFKNQCFASVAKQEAAKINLAPEYAPLVSRDTQITPTAEPTFKPDKVVPTYLEVYEPLLEHDPTLTVQVRMRVTDPTGEPKVNFPWFDATPYRGPGTNTFAIIKYVYFTQLSKGSYELEAQARDSRGNTTAWRSADFTLDPQFSADEPNGGPPALRALALPLWTHFGGAGWSISYPAYWTVGRCKSCKDSKARASVDFFPGKTKTADGWITVEPLSDKPLNVSEEAWLEEVSTTADQNPRLHEHKSTLNGLSALTVRYRTPQKQEVERVYVVSSSGKTFSISFRGDLDTAAAPQVLEDLHNYQTYSTMLAMFRAKAR